MQFIERISTLAHIHSHIYGPPPLPHSSKAVLVPLQYSEEVFQSNTDLSDC